MNMSKFKEFFNPAKDKARIHIIGCGSVGSTVAENLVRMGITNITLYDFDSVNAHNIANQMFREKDIHKLKVDACAEMLTEINPAVADGLKLQPEGWNGQRLAGYVFLCVDSIELRRKIVEANMSNRFVKAMFDFRTRLQDAQHYAADWSSKKDRENFLKSMQFSHEEAAEETPVSACGVTLGVCTTVRIICAYGVSNFINFWNGKTLKKLVIADAFNMEVDAF